MEHELDKRVALICIDPPLEDGNHETFLLEPPTFLAIHKDGELTSHFIEKEVQQTNDDPTSEGSLLFGITFADPPHLRVDIYASPDEISVEKINNTDFRIKTAEKNYFGFVGVNKTEIALRALHYLDLRKRLTLSSSN